VKGDFTFWEHGCPDIIHNDLLDGAEVFAFACQVNHSNLVLDNLTVFGLPTVVPDAVVDSHSKMVRTQIEEGWLNFKISLCYNHVVFSAINDRDLSQRRKDCCVLVKGWVKWGYYCKESHEVAICGGYSQDWAVTGPVDTSDSTATFHNLNFIAVDFRPVHKGKESHAPGGGYCYLSEVCVNRDALNRIVANLHLSNFLAGLSGLGANHAYDAWGKSYDDFVVVIPLESEGFSEIFVELE
jgi:hypothetical protein